MKKEQIIVLVAALVLSFGILASLYAVSPLSKEMRRASFERNFISNPGAPGPVMDLEFDSFYIAGYSDSTIYFGNSTAPFHLLKTNLTLTDSQHVMLRVDLDGVSDPKRFRLSVASPYFYLAHGVEPIILKGNFSDWTARPFIKDGGYYFSEAVSSGAETFALRSYNGVTQSYELARKTSGNFKFHNDLLEKQLDGMFCVDGKLMFNRKLNKFVYLYFYRNQFVVADTNLVLNYRGHTIDTFSHVRIKVAEIKAGESMMSSPPMMVNGLSCTDGEFLYVQSGLLARNQDYLVFKASVTIDCYRLTDRIYVGSFHIPRYAKQDLTGFQVVNDRLFAIFGKYLVTHHLNPLPLESSNGQGLSMVLTTQH